MKSMFMSGYVYKHNRNKSSVTDTATSEYKHRYTYIPFYSVLVSVSCPKALFHLESDNLFRITVVVAD